ERAHRAAELPRDDDERLVEQRLARGLAGCRLEIGDQIPEGRIELRRLRVEVRTGGLVVDAAVHVPPADGDHDKARAASAREELLGDEAAVAEGGVAVAGAVPRRIREELVHIR